MKAMYRCGYGILCLLFIQTFALSWFILAAVEIEMATCKNPAWAYLLDILTCFVVCERELINGRKTSRAGSSIFLCVLYTAPSNL